MPDSAAVTVRPATLADAGDVARLLTDLGSSDVDEGEASRRLQRGHEQVFVAIADQRIGGLVAVKIELYFGHAAPLAHITALVTRPDTRRGGLARALVDAAHDWARANRCVGIELTCGLTPAREAAHRFYEAQGFAPTSLRYARPLDTDANASRSDESEGRAS